MPAESTVAVGTVAVSCSEMPCWAWYLARVLFRSVSVTGVEPSSSLRKSARVNTDVMSAQDNQVIGMTSHAVVEARHGLILCTAWYSTFCKEADGQLLHHHPTAALRSRHRRGGMHIRP